MSQLIALNDILVSEVVCNDSPLTQIAVLRRYWIAATIVTPGTFGFAQLAAGLDTVFAPLYKAVMYNNAAYNGIRVRRIKPIDVPLDAWAVVTANAGVGTAGAAGAPGQVAGLLKFTGNFIGKQAQGRQYLPFVSVSSVQLNGIPTALYLSNASDIAVQCVTQQVIAAGSPFGTIAFNPVLFRPGVTTGFGIPITTGVCENAFATQKRRGAFGRFNKPPF